MDSDELSGEEAAKMLHVSRVFVSKLIAEGTLPGAHTADDGLLRIPRNSVIAYKRAMKMEQRAGLDKMIAASESAGLYEAELKELEVRGRKRSS